MYLRYGSIKPLQQYIGDPIVQRRQLEASPGVFQVVLLAWKRLCRAPSLLSRHDVPRLLMIRQEKIHAVRAKVSLEKSYIRVPAEQWERGNVVVCNCMVERA